MRNVPRCTVVVAWMLATVVAADLALAQTPEQMEYDRQQREYRRQQEQQREEQQRQQQLMQDNARRQQQESSRINAGAGQGAGGGAPGAPQGRGGNAGGGDNATAAARAMWQKRPPLAAEQNPLLRGRWTRPASNATNSSDPFAGLQALMKGGLCEALFGGGMFEFRADRLVGMDQRTPEQELDRVEYRGDAKHVVVIPKTTLNIMEFDVVSPDRISWTAQNCVLVHAGAGASRAADAAGTPTAPAARSAAPASAAPGTTATAPAKGVGGGALTLSVGAASADNQLAGRRLMVLKEDAQVALVKGGVTSTASGTVLQTWLRACYSHAPACAQGAGALKPYMIGIATTDATGHAQTPHLPPGRYWVVSDVKVGPKHIAWNQPVDVGAGDKALTLDAHNAMPVD